ncbi:MAG: hypothetical protein JNL17_00195 [Cyclobacteriaceae bacterium]|nr:hypothetical protein [Cyclobacteriaceae bacterium]
MKRLIILLLITSWSFGLVAQVKSTGLQGYQASGHVHHNSAEVKKVARSRGTSVSVAGNLIKLKAVLLVGPIESDRDATTLEYINNLKAAAKVLRDNKVDVKEFYTPNNNWEEIKKAAAGAHFLIYKGHGVYDGSEPPKWVGGFCLKGSFPSPDEVRSDLALADNSVILISGCFTAGNAGYDIGKIDINEAKRRVAMYSEPFFSNRSAVYYANWYPDAFATMLQNLFAGQTFGQAYRSYPNGNNPAKILDFPYPHRSGLKMCIGSEDYSGQTAFNNAFVGDEGKTLMDFFKK